MTGGDGVLGRATITLEVTVRPCIEQDLPALEWMGLFAPHREIIRNAFEAQQRGDALLLLGMAAGFPVGQVWIDLARKRADGVAVLWAVRTFPLLQGTGIGRLLMEAAEAVLRERGIRRAELGVERDKEGALRFYERLGWTIAGPLVESFSYTGLDGNIVVEQLAQWRMTKNLAV
jgi:GNAT superfamily N-acetyltransferase